ncbi:MAG: bile acid:sodium symporter [Candidatus Sumerlaeia bacterium]|nr:bile acid:sodium symporter [Candidatus Sumerlaeia bacterium]
MSLKSIFLPGGLLLAILIGLIYPTPGDGAAGLSLGPMGLQQFLIILVFLISGFKIKRGDFQLGGKFPMVLAAALVINLLLGPALAVALTRFVATSEGFFLGLIVMSCVPTTLSSCVIIVRTVNGNVAWALILMVALTFVGIMVLPFTLAIALGVAADIHVPIGALLLQIFLLLLLPLFIGMGIQRTGLKLNHPIVDYLPPTSIILIVWMAVSGNADALSNLGALDIATFSLSGLAVHGGLLLASWAVSRMLVLNTQDAIALIIVASQKTLPIAITVLIAFPASVLANGILGIATVVCVVFHFTQIVFDSILVQLFPKGR